MTHLVVDAGLDQQVARRRGTGLLAEGQPLPGGALQLQDSDQPGKFWCAVVG
jgi:hypothetical protein